MNGFWYVPFRFGVPLGLRDGNGDIYVPIYPRLRPARAVSSDVRRIYIDDAAEPVHGNGHLLRPPAPNQRTPEAGVAATKKEIEAHADPS